jgi:plastocyanin
LPEEDIAVRFLRVLSMFGAVMVFAACGGGTPSGGTGGAGTTRPAGGTPAAASAAGRSGVACTGSGGQAVSIQNFAFNPASTTVSAGSSVTWTNNDSAPHTVTFDSGPDCGNLANGATKTATFSTAGSYAYICTIHPQMKGTVVVQ